MADKVRLNPALRTFWRTRSRHKVLVGGRSSSKSWDAAGIAVQFARLARLRVLCTRQFQNKISESVYTLLKIQIERMGLLHEFDILESSIRHKVTGSEFLFYGLWRHIDEIKSLESIDILWIEEAHNLTSAQWEVLEPTIRKEGSQVWVIFNPRFASDFVYQRFVVNPPPDTITRLINYDENPFLSQTILKVIQAKQEEDPEEFEHIYKGVPRDSDDGVVIKRSWIMAAIDAHKTVKPSRGEWFGSGIVGYDVADSGDDFNATTSMKGSVCVGLDEWKGDIDKLFESSTRAMTTAAGLGTGTVLGYDSIGVGAGTGSNLNQQGFRKHFKFNAGGKVARPDKVYKDSGILNRDFFANLKAQTWWDVADRLSNTFQAVRNGREFPADQMISISSDIDSRLLDKLVDELSTPLKDEDNGGRVKVESKKDLSKRDVVSPNLADSFIIANSRATVGTISLKELL